MLQLQRWREPTLAPRQRRWALLLVGLLHALFVLMLWFGMRGPMSTPVVAASPVEVMQVRFITRAPLAKQPPPPAALAPPPRPRVPPKVHKPLAKDAMVVQPAPPPAQPLRLYDEHGQPLLPTATSAPVAAYVQRMPQGDMRVMQTVDPIKYQPTRFAPYFPPSGETLGGAVRRHVLDAVVKSKKVDLPHGIHLKCTTLLGIPTPLCRDPPPPPSAKDGDARLSMAPARSLDGRAHGSKPPSLEACIAMYRGGKPLAYGCPVDTPDRSVDAERRARAAKTGVPP